MNEVLRNIMNRASVRAYTDKPVENEKIEALLRAAMAAPSARNSQPWNFYAITDRRLLQKLGENLPNAPMLKTAPLAIMPCGNTDKMLAGAQEEFWIQDCSAATENILIAVCSMELGAVWTAVYPDATRGKTVAEILSLPENIRPLCLIAIGYPAVQSVPKDKYREDSIIRI